MNKNLFLLLFLGVGSLCFAKDKKPASITCNASAPLTYSEFSESGLKSWLLKNQQNITQVEDFICCLPKEIQKNFIVTHSSFAAQNAVPPSPRVLLFNERRPGQLFSAFTINGGNHPALVQALNIEMAFENKKTQELEYFDLEFYENGTFHFSEKNPALCLSCHGKNGEVPVGGMRPVFDPPGQSAVFVQGKNQFCSAAEQSVFQSLDDLSIKSMQTLPRFRCLDQNTLNTYLDAGKSNSSISLAKLQLQNFNQSLTALNEIRVAKSIRDEKSFAEIKDSLLGLAVCGGELSAWLKPEIYKKVQSRENLKSEYKTPEWRSAFRTDLIALNKKSKHFSDQLLADMNGKKSTLELGIAAPEPSRIQCNGDLKSVEDSFQSFTAKDIKTDLKIQWTEKDLEWAAPLLANLVVRNFEGDLIFAGIMEILGADIGNWQMSSLKEGNRTPVFVVNEVLRQELESNKTWSKKVNKFFTAKKDQNILSLDENSCENFQKLITSKK